MKYYTVFQKGIKNVKNDCIKFFLLALIMSTEKDKHSFQTLFERRKLMVIV